MEGRGRRPDIDSLIRATDVDGLVEAASYTDHQVREQAILALGSLGTHAGRQAVTSALHDPADPVRCAAVRVLHQRRAALPLVEALWWLPADDGRSLELARRAVTSLGDAVDARETVRALVHAEDERLLGDEDLDLIAELLDHGSAKRRREVIGSLVTALSDERAIAVDRAGELLVALAPRSTAALAEELRSGSAPAGAASILGKIADPGSVEVLVEALSHEDPKVRAESAAALAEIGDPLAVVPLVHAVDDPDRTVRMQAAAALDEFGSTAVIMGVTELLRPVVVEVVSQTEAQRGHGRPERPALGSTPPVDPSIFKAYDVRGTYPDQMDEELAYRIGRAFARVLSDLEDTPTGELTVALGRDMRLSAPAMAAQYARGIADEGADVLDVGMAGTEMVYWTVGSRGLDGGLVCTASHNPASYTGAKLVRRGALALSGDSGIAELRELVSAGEPGPPAESPGTLTTEDVSEPFREAALGYIDPEKIRPLKLVLDGGNGMAGPMVGPLLDRFPVEQITTYWEPDGEFPDHEPNPLLEENRRFIIEKVRETGADLGIAWDGDADRCFFIDDSGEFVAGDFLTALLAESILEKEPGATVLYDVRASRAVRDVVEGAGGSALVNRVGHAFFKTRMRDTGAAFGGEVSGHYYFRDFYCADSGAIPALLVLELVSTRGRSLSELLEPLRSRYFISGEINSEVEDQDAKVAELKARYSDGEVSELDGVSVGYDDWHFNVRPSNTEPLLRLNLESVVSREHMEEKRDEVLGLIRG